MTTFTNGYIENPPGSDPEDNILQSRRLATSLPCRPQTAVLSTPRKIVKIESHNLEGDLSPSPKTTGENFSNTQRERNKHNRRYSISGNSYIREYSKVLSHRTKEEARKAFSESQKIIFDKLKQTTIDRLHTKRKQIMRLGSPVMSKIDQNLEENSKCAQQNQTLIHENLEPQKRKVICLHCFSFTRKY